MRPILQAPDGESQPSTEVDLFISTEKIMVLNTDLKVSKGFIMFPCWKPLSENPPVIWEVYWLTSGTTYTGDDGGRCIYCLFL